MREAPWVEKHRPRRLKDVLGNPSVVKRMEGWLLNWKGERHKALLIHGPAGCGKTTAAYALAEEHDREVVELNASDFRRKVDINDIMGNAATQQSLYRRERILLLDEVDGIHGTADRGGLPSLLKIIRATAYPVILTANDIYRPKLRPLRNLCEVVPFRKPAVVAVKKALRRVVDTEGRDVEDELLTDIASRSGGDIRAAINDLQTALAGALPLADLEALGNRDQTRSLTEAVRIVLKTRNIQHALEATDNLTEDPDTVFTWIAHNVALEYDDPEDLSRAMDRLSRADVFRGRIFRSQNWRYLVYMRDLMTAGVALAKRDKYRKFVKYGYPQRIIRMGRSKELRATRDEIAEKVARRCHTSRRVVIDEYLPVLVRVLPRSPELAEGLGLTESDVAFLAEFLHR